MDLMGAMSHDADVMVQNGEKLELVWTYGVDKLPGQNRSKAAKRRAPAPRRSPPPHVKHATLPV